MDKQKVVIGADHAGFEHKEAAKKLLAEMGYEVEDKGTDSPDSVDYPDYVHPVADFIESGKARQGIIFCGSGNGVAMTANKHKGIRAAISWNKEIAKLARQHNDANILAIPSRFVDRKAMLEMIKTFLETEFEGGRHARRVNKIPCQ